MSQGIFVNLWMLEFVKLKVDIPFYLIVLLIVNAEDKFSGYQSKSCS